MTIYWGHSLAMKPHVTGTLRVDSQHSLYWAEYGDPKGKPLLMIHGASGHVLPMARMTCLEDTDLRVIEMHQRGVGYSTPYGQTEHNTIGHNVRDIGALQNHLEISRMSIFAWSFGATLMADYAFAYPDRCDALVTYAPFLGSQEDYDVLARKKPKDAAVYFDAQGTRNAQIIAENFYKSSRTGTFEERMDSYYQSQKIWNPELDKDVMRAKKTLAEWDSVFQGRAVSAGMYWELYHQKNRFLENYADIQGPIEHPVALIYGAEDGWSGFNSYADYIFANKKVITVAGAGHSPDHPGVQAALYEQFGLL